MNAKTWNGLNNFYATGIWIDGINIYYSKGSDQYVLKDSIVLAKTVLNM